MEKEQIKVIIVIVHHDPLLPGYKRKANVNRRAKMTHL
jgi:hypothetical protein